MKSTTNDPDHSLPYHIRGAFRGFETTLIRYLTTVDLPISHFHILRLKWGETGHTQKDLARRAFMTESAASQVIQQMTAAGLLNRAVDPKDKRKRLVVLTQTGFDMRERVVTEGMEISKLHSPDISREDYLTTISVMKKIRAAFDIYNEAYFQDK